MMECKRCGNKDPAYFYKGSKGIYCRKCIRFSRVLLEEEMQTYEYEIGEAVDDYAFDYKLTDLQLEASGKINEKIDECDILLNCVCGSGKTELVIETMSRFLKEGKKVAYAISRKEVVVELEKRFKSIFRNADVVSVYGGHHERLTGDLIICTCHQLYRYHNTFDLLILDEADAFPLKGNETLMEICLRSCKGKVIFSTATLNDDLKRVLKKRKYETVNLYVRPSGKPLSVPSVFYMPQIFSVILLFVILKRHNEQFIVFVYSKKMTRILYYIFRYFTDCAYVYSDLDKRNQVIEDFRNRKHRVLFSTLVLERGITIKGISVAVFQNNRCFDEGNIIQMLGRVGRGVNNDAGVSYLFTNHLDKTIVDVLKYLRKANSFI